MPAQDGCPGSQNWVATFAFAAVVLLIGIPAAAKNVAKVAPPPSASIKREKSDVVNIAPRRPRLPDSEPGTKLTNPIDLLLQGHFKSVRVDMNDAVPDVIFVRRVWLDVIGLLPPVDELDAFIRDASTDKRTTLVRRLLAQRDNYAEHWIAFWNDLLRNEYRGTGFIDDGRRQITAWLFRSLYENKPYDKFVKELVNPVPGSEGFVKGIEWRGVVNASQRREMQAAQTTAQVFLGTNLKCASCHNSFTNQWTLADSHGLAAVFSDRPLDVYRCDKATGDYAKASFLFPEVGAVDPNAPRAAKMKQLAELMAAPKNGRLAKTVVNRYWSRLFGRGLVEPLDDMDVEAWHPDLLDWLASDLMDHGYDLKHTLELICTSRTYQLPSAGESKPNEPARPFRGPLVRRMSAEQFLDAVATLTNVWPGSNGSLLKQDGRGQGGQLGAIRAVLASDKSRIAKSPDRVRAALELEDPLSRAMGRPNREQVVTRRDSLATMLQALELTNGTTLDCVLKKGAAAWRKKEGRDSRKLVERVYREALGRTPSAGELQIAVQLLGAAPSADGIQDFLWMVVMLPEFQLIL